MPVCIYPEACTDFTTNGLGVLTPLECTVEEQAAGMYELTLVHPIDESLRWGLLQPGCILKAPAPVRETPLCEAAGDAAEGEGAAVTREIYKANTGRMYLRQNPWTAAVKLCALPHKAEVVLLEHDGGKWARVAMAQGGQTGWCPFGGLTFVRSQEEPAGQSGAAGQGVVQPAQSREQLFRIYSVEQDSAQGVVTARALHIFYDAAGDLITGELSPAGEDVNAVLAAMEALRVGDRRIRICALNLSAPVTGEYGFKSPVEALLNPDGGIVKQTGAWLVRDNLDAILIPAAGRDRGVTIRRGKNLVGVQAVSDCASTATRILPVGRDAGGNPLYIEEVFVDSPRPAGQTRIRCIEYGVQVGQNGISSVDAARAELRRLAGEEFSRNGADLPLTGMDVDFVLLQNTAEYANYASLQAVHLYDTVTVIDERIGLRAKLRVTGYKFDCLTRQYRGVTLGEIQSLEQTVYAYSLPDGGVSGTKIAPGTLSGTALRSATIQYAKISSAAVEQLSADAITALTARIREIVAEKLTADELCAAYAEMLALKAGTITADNIQTDALAAELARITVLAAGTAQFDRATVQHLVAQAMNLEFGVAGQVFVKNLAVEYAQMVGAAIGELCIKASDGNYYLLDVSPDGTVAATLATVSDDEITAGETSGGRMILETSITAANLNTSSLLATCALVNRIDAARIDVDELFAREAFIETLRTAKIVGGKSITLMAQELALAIAGVDVEYYHSTSPTELAGGSWNSAAPQWEDGKYVWSRTTTRLMNGQTYSANVACIAGATGQTGASGVGVSGITEQFYLSSSKTGLSGGSWLDSMPQWSAGLYVWTRSKISYTDNTVQYTAPCCDSTWEIAAECSVYDGVLPPSEPPAAGKLWLDRSVSPPLLRRWKGGDCETADPEGWETVNDTAGLKEALGQTVTKEELQHVVRVQADGLHVGAEGSTGEVRIDHDSVDVLLGGRTFSSFGQNYVEFGNYQLRRTADGGLAFKKR